MKIFDPKRRCRFFLSLLTAITLLSCERESLSDYAFPDYDGALEWEEVTNKAEWKKRYDHDAVVFDNKMWIIGGYNPGVVKGDPYFEDVWNSSDGKNWDLVLDNADWKGRRGHALINFDDGSGEAMFLIGGFSVNEESGYREYCNDVWKSTDGENWKKIKSRTNPPIDTTNDWFPRMHHKCVVANHNGTNYIYLIGGRGMYDSGDALYATKYFNDIWRSEDGISWERLTNNDYGIRSEHAATVDPNGRIYIQGGMFGLIVENTENSGRPLPDWNYLWSSDDGINWTPQADDAKVDGAKRDRAAHEMIYYKDKIWTLPGKTISHTHYQFTYSSNYITWTFDSSDAWDIDSEGVAIDARHSYSTVVFQDKIWILGGYTNRKGQSSDVWSAKLK